MSFDNFNTDITPGPPSIQIIRPSKLQLLSINSELNSTGIVPLDSSIQRTTPILLSASMLFVSKVIDPRAFKLK